MLKRLCELKIQQCSDREAVVTALANAGYLVTVEERNKRPISSGDFYVVVMTAPKETDCK